MKADKKRKDSRLIPILREGVAVIQMIFFKNLKPLFKRKYPKLDTKSHAMLAGAVTNEIFGASNSEKRFQDFHQAHHGIIEQELLDIPSRFPELAPYLSDALRIQTICDNQEGSDSTHILKQADTFGILLADREIPLPSQFMETVRTLGALHKLIIPPVEIDTIEEQDLIQ